MGRKRPWGCCMYILPAQMCLHLMIVKGGDVPCSAQPSRLGRYLADCFGGQRSHIYRRTLSVLEPRTEWAPSKACFCTCEGNISDELGCMEPPDAGRISSCMLRVFGGHSLGSIGRVGPWGRHRSRYDIYPGVSLSMMSSISASIDYPSLNICAAGQVVTHCAHVVHNQPSASAADCTSSPEARGRLDLPHPQLLLTAHSLPGRNSKNSG